MGAITRREAFSLGYVHGLLASKMPDFKEPAPPFRLGGLGTRPIKQLEEIFGEALGCKVLSEGQAGQIQNLLFAMKQGRDAEAPLSIESQGAWRSGYYFVCRGWDLPAGSFCRAEILQIRGYLDMGQKRCIQAVPQDSKAAVICGDEVLALRLALGLSQEKLARVIGISAACISRAETGKRPLHPDAMARLRELMSTK